VAVVSISRIQVRRGQKNQGSGLPQLASGEFGWAIDTQELYIGNGSVAEGAPFVGNTKLLSENDNLFQFADTYAYKGTLGFIQTGVTSSTPVYRTLQDRLDDTVSIRAFGGQGDGTDHTVILQRAIDQLYLNASNKGTPQARIELVLEAGEYTVSSTIYVPPFVTIKGAGIDKTIINATTTASVFQTINEESTVGSYADDSITTTLNQAREITLSGLTINTINGIALDLRNVKNSSFSDIKIQGNWSIGDADEITECAISLTSLSTAVTCSNNVFDNIQILGYSHGVVSDYDIKDNVWKACNFNTLYTAFEFGTNSQSGVSGQSTGPVYNVIENCIFDDIYATAILIATGKFNTTQSNKFYNVGNAGGSEGSARWPIITFGQATNQSDLDWFERSQKLGSDATFFVNYPYIPELSGPSLSRIGYTQRLTISESGEYSKLLKFPAADEVQSYVVEYIYKSQQVNASRSGRIELIVDPDNSTVQLSDDYNFTGDNNYALNLRFRAEVYDENSDTVVDTVAIEMLNSTSSDNATFTFNILRKS
jgi:hypothetical protein